MTTTTVHVDGRTVEVTPLPRRVGLDVTDSVHDEAITVLLPFADAARIAAALDPNRANGGQWTREDLPGDSEGQWATFKSRFGAFDGYRSPSKQHDLWTVFKSGGQYAVGHALDSLNAHHPKPVPYDQGGWPKSDAVGAAWKRLYEQAEAARDAAVARADEAEKRAEALDKQAHDWADMYKVAAERAEKAERERWVHTTPAVSRADIEKAVGDAFDHERDQGGGWPGTVPITNAVYALVSGDDPAVHVVRESALPEAIKDGQQWRAGIHTWLDTVTADELRESIPRTLAFVAAKEAAVRAIEAEQAVDPVEAKAREMLGVAYPGTDGAWPLMREDEREGYRRLAAHVLGQEASSDE